MIGNTITSSEPYFLPFKYSIVNNVCELLKLYSRYSLSIYPCAELKRLWGFEEVEAPKISTQSVYEVEKVISSRHRLPVPLRRYSWYSFMLRAESTTWP
jgi:hypothetical protein